jgi:hypothetical protein
MATNGTIGADGENYKDDPMVTMVTHRRSYDNNQMAPATNSTVAFDVIVTIQSHMNRNRQPRINVGVIGVMVTKGSPMDHLCLQWITIVVNGSNCTTVAIGSPMDHHRHQ